ncbi:MAG TPA: hypothetical protein VNW99_12905 [Cytophagaceae bacterium]|jgi:hypothetical protein|nr:hypothetical protein [Cytophagaceae bacterium]
MESPGQKFSTIKNIFAGAAIVLTIAISFVLYFFIMGNGSNFSGGNSE